MCSRFRPFPRNFYPRPPRGGRPEGRDPQRLQQLHFYPRPPRGGRPRSASTVLSLPPISTHALREEGDCSTLQRTSASCTFLPTPSARRATLIPLWKAGDRSISTHALREEGDGIAIGAAEHRVISTHALREEGDLSALSLPPLFHVFLPTPSARRATVVPAGAAALGQISTHALREEGDRVFTTSFAAPDRFLPTPSARRATSGAPCCRVRPCNFYPRPPRGGRPGGRRSPRRWRYFYPRPPRGGRPASDLTASTNC